MSEKYKVVEGSNSCHCCFTHTVINTGKQELLGDTVYYETICETFTKEDAELVCSALNKADKQ